MRQLIRQREVQADSWRYPGEAGEGAQALTLAQLLAGAATLPASGIGVVLQPEEAAESLAPHIARLSLVVIRFPKQGEGRGYSQARLLRQRYGYRGELRAAGAIKRDQLQLLARCGCDSFDLDPGEDLRASLDYFAVYSVAYQPAGDQAEASARRRYPVFGA